MIGIGIAAVLVVLIILFVINIVNRNYVGYEVLNTAERSDSNTVHYLPYGGNILKYSRDGASALAPDGSPIWNGSYEMKAPYADVCGSYVVIADIGGKECYVFNGSDSGTLIRTLDPILQVRVASQGVVAVVTEQKDANLITVYNPYDASNQVVFEIPTVAAESGYPTGIALSQDGIKLATAYVSVKGGVLESSLTIYNLGDVGKNNINYVVGAKAYEQNLIGELKFLNKDVLCVFTETGYTLFKGSQIPEEAYTVTLEEEIRSIFHTDSQVGLITENKEAEGGRYRVRVFGTGSEEPALNTTIDFNYESVSASGKDILFTSGNSCLILTNSGSEKFRYSFDYMVQYLFPGNGKNRYCLISDTSIEEIRLSRKDNQAEAE